jgi:LmbE family N-acetylglucosaminyl deacetylase
MSTWFPVFLASLFGVFGHQSASDIAVELDRLQTNGRVLYVAAHPDDENTQLLAYLASETGYRTAYLSMTRGDGGQNLIGTEQRDGLGVIRTWELLAARNTDRAEQFIATMRDFGYSKSAEEALRVWGEERALRDAVWVVRHFRPHAIITRFPEEGETHGHHLASARLARQAYTLAADPTAYPEQLEFADVWDTPRLMHNVPTWYMEPADVDPNWVTVDVGAYNPLIGESYGEISATSRSMHRSQGFGQTSVRGEDIEYLAPLEGTFPDDISTLNGDPLAGLDVHWEGMGDMAELLAAARDAYDPRNPETIIPALAVAMREAAALPDEQLAATTTTRLAEMIAACDGLFLDVRAPGAALPVGSPTELTWTVTSRRGATTAIQGVRVRDASASISDGVVQENVPLSGTFSVTADQDTMRSHYWLHPDATDSHDNIDDYSLVGDPIGSRDWSAEIDLVIDGNPITLVRPVRTVATDRVLGERVRPVQTTPPVAVTPVAAVVMTNAGTPAAVELDVEAFIDTDDAVVRLQMPAGWTSSPTEIPMALAAGGKARVRFEVSAPAGADVSSLTPTVNVGGDDWAWQAQLINYEHIPVQWMVTPATVAVTPLQAAPYEGVVGYIHGPGDLVAESLRGIGVEVRDVSIDQITAEGLDGLTALMVGIRAFNTQPELHALIPTITEWVEGGGIFIVQYQTSGWRSPLTDALGPDALTIGRGRVTDEFAEIRLLEDDVIFRLPNALTEADFAGWVQERGLYFGQDWADSWVPLMGIADQGEEELQGALLMNAVGDGRAYYCGLSLFRQLPAGVPGAYRLLLNMLTPE